MQVSNLLRYFFLISVLIITTSAHTQNRVIDSLTTLLHNHKKNDTIKADILYELAFKLFQKDSKLTQSYIRKAEIINEAQDYQRGRADILSLKGIIESRKSNYFLASNYFKESLEIFISIDDKKGIASSYNSIGINLFKQNKNKEALPYLKQALKIYEAIGDKDKLVAGYLNIGNIYASTGTYPQAISYYKKVVTLSREIQHEYGEPYALNNLGHIYKEQGNSVLALKYYKEGLFYKEKLRDTLGMANTLNSLGNTYRTFKKYDKAIAYHNKSLKLALQIKNKDLVATNKGNIGIIYKNKKAYKKALKFMNESLALSTEINDLGQVSNCLNNIGEINLLINNTAKARQSFKDANAINITNGNKYGMALNYLGIAQTYYKEQAYYKALDYTKRGKKIADELQLLVSQKIAYELLSNIFEKQGNYKKALESHQQFKTLNDSLFNKESIEKITQLEYEYKYKQALDSANIRELRLTKTVKATTQDLEKSQRNLFLGVIGFLITALVLGGIIFFLRLRNEKTKTQNIAIEQKLLRSQMTPHFIFNSLSVLQGMILNKEDKKSMHYLSKFSKLLRITLENSRGKMVLLHQELEAINNYLELQNLEETQAYKYTILVEDTIDDTLIEIPPMLIQPFIENAIEHAFVNQKADRKIDIRLVYKTKNLICTIADNGVGIDFQNENQQKHKKSLATKITSERLKMLSKNFDSKGSVTIEDRRKYNEQGTLVTLVIPHKIIETT